MAHTATTSWPQVLDDLVRVERRGRVRVAVLQWTTCALATWLGWFVLDAAVPTPGGVRAVVGPTLVLATAAGLGRAWRVRRRRGEHVARRVERMAGMAANPLINATQLPEHAAVQRHGVAALAAVPGRSMLRGRAWWATAACAAAVLAWFVLGVAMPRVLTVGVWRLVQPWRDHPPFTTLDFDITVEPDVVRMGGDAVVKVVVSGGRVEGLGWVQWDDAGGVLRRGPMQGHDGDTFTHRFTRVTEPITFHVEAAAGRSRRVTIVPQATLEVPPDATTTQADATGSERDRWRAALRALQQRVDALRQRLADSGEHADLLAMQPQLDALSSGVADLALQLPTAVAEALQQVGPPPQPPTPATLDPWLAAVQRALDDARGRLGDAVTDSGHVSSRGGDAGAAPDDAPLATGSLTRGPAPSPRDALDDPTRAMLEQAPPAYRALVADYVRPPAPPPPPPPEGNPP